MDKSHEMPRKLGRVCLVLELEVPRSGPIQWVRLTSSIPGRDSALTRVWSVSNGVIPLRTAEDLSCWIDKTFWDALELLGGAQTELPM